MEYTSLFRMNLGSSDAPKWELLDEQRADGSHNLVPWIEGKSPPSPLPLGKRPKMKVVTTSWDLPNFLAHKHTSISIRQWHFSDQNSSRYTSANAKNGQKWDFSLFLTPFHTCIAHKHNIVGKTQFRALKRSFIQSIWIRTREDTPPTNCQLWGLGHIP